MNKKKFTKDQIIDAIIEKFGSVESYASSAKTTRSNIYQKINVQTPKFLKQLRDAGVELGPTQSIGSIKQQSSNSSGDDMTVAGNINGDRVTFKESGSKELYFIIEQLKTVIAEKDKIIAELKKRLGE